MKTRALVLSFILVAGMVAVGCSDDDGGDSSGTGGSGGASAGAGGSSGKGGSTGKGGAQGSTGGSSNNGGTGGGISGMPVQCPGGTPACDDNTLWYCNGSMPTMKSCGNSKCESGKCVCSSDTDCQSDQDKSWVECDCVDGQTVKKTGNELASCNTGTGQCTELDMDTACKAVCKDNGGDGELVGVGFGT